MGEVNGRRESRASESDSEPPVPVQGAQPSTKNGRIPGLFRADRQTERLFAWAMLAEREGFELSVSDGTKLQSCGSVDEEGALTKSLISSVLC